MNTLLPRVEGERDRERCLSLVGGSCPSPAPRKARPALTLGRELPDAVDELLQGGRHLGGGGGRRRRAAAASRSLGLAPSPASGVTSRPRPGQSGAAGRSARLSAVTSGGLGPSRCYGDRPSSPPPRPSSRKGAGARDVNRGCPSSISAPGYLRALTFTSKYFGGTTTPRIPPAWQSGPCSPFFF